MTIIHEGVLPGGPLYRSEPCVWCGTVVECTRDEITFRVGSEENTSSRRYEAECPKCRHHHVIFSDGLFK
jgi:hypothetical protein